MRVGGLEFEIHDLTSRVYIENREKGIGIAILMMTESIPSLVHFYESCLSEWTLEATQNAPIPTSTISHGHCVI